MDRYPEELRTPPMPLVALVGMSELHSAISLSLHSEQLPLNTLAIPDMSKIAAIAGKERKPVDARMPPPVGILKADWLAKHRTRSPAVLTVLLRFDEVYGDPAQWLQVCSSIDNIKNVTRGRNIKVVVAIVQPSLSCETMEDRLTAVRKRLEIDAKHCFLFTTHNSSELKRSLLRLGSIMSELASMFYRDEGRRIKLRLEKKTYSSTELSIRYNFKVSAVYCKQGVKDLVPYRRVASAVSLSDFVFTLVSHLRCSQVAVFAEFRRDWVSALKFYESAYSLLPEVINAHAELHPIQRIAELKAVAEQLHFKVSTLLLHGGKETEAVKWFRQHISWYKRLIGPSEGSFLHWAWISYQYQVFGELLERSMTSAAPTQLPGPPVADRELQPGYYFQVAASYMFSRRRWFESAQVTFEALDEEGAVDVLSGSREEVGSPLYVGQAPRLLRRGNTVDLQRPTETEYLRHAILNEKGFAHSRAAIDLLTRAQDHCKRNQSHRMTYQLGSEIGREHFNSREYEKAKRLFEDVAGMYRKEAWVAILGATLGYLKECARHLGQLQEYIEYALELASLPIPETFGPDVHRTIVSGPEVGPAGPVGQFQREQVYKEVVGLLRGTTSVLPAREDVSGMTVSLEHPVALEIDLVSPLRIFLTAFVAFHEQVVKPDAVTFLTLSLLTHLPLSLQLSELEVHFSQPDCSFVLRSSEDLSLEPSSLCELQGPSEPVHIKYGYDLDLKPSKWKRFTVAITPSKSGKLECLAVVARLGPHASVRCQVEGPATQSGIFLWTYEPAPDSSPMKDSNLAQFGQKILQVEETEPLVDVDLMVSTPALVEEAFPVNIVVKSKGDPVRVGELDMYLAAPNPIPAGLTRTSSVISSSIGPAVAEILCSGDDEYTKFVGPHQVPSLEPGEEWVITVYLKWSVPKSVNLVVLLGYQTRENMVSNESGSHGPRLGVQKNLLLECQEALDVSYEYVSPLRSDALLPIALVAEQAIPSTALALQGARLLFVKVKNSSSLTVNLQTVNILGNDSDVWTVKKPSTRRDFVNLPLRPDEVFTELFSVCPLTAAPAVSIGRIVIGWCRSESPNHTAARCPIQKIMSLASENTRQVGLNSVVVESPPIIVTLESPPHAILGVPFMCCMRIQNATTNLQDITFSVYDTQSFIFSGAHSDTLSILPKSTMALLYKLVPIAAGLQQLPQVRLTISRYKSGFQPSTLGTQLFVYPSACWLVTPESCQKFDNI